MQEVLERKLLEYINIAFPIIEVPESLQEYRPEILYVCTFLYVCANQRCKGQVCSSCTCYVCTDIFYDKDSKLDKNRYLKTVKITTKTFCAK